MTRRVALGAAALAIGLGAACGGDGTGPNTGRAMGTVRDTAMVLLEGVTVVLRDSGTVNVVGSIATNAAGVYDFPGVATGSYDVVLLVPAAMQLAPGGTNPTNVAVTTGGTATADFSLRYVPVSLSGHVQPIFSASCASFGCHGNTSPQQGMNLSLDSTYTYTVNVASVEVPAMDRIEPGNPATSYLVHKINGTQATVGGGGTATMPSGAPQLPLQTRRMIARWVTEGALDN